MTYFLDTNIIVFVLRKNPNQNILNALEKISRKDVLIPSVVKAELIHGALKSKNAETNLDAVQDFTSFFEIIPFDDKASFVYGKMRAEMEKNGYSIGPNDMFIAATVLSQGGILVTNNTKEFSRVNGLQIEDWCR